MKKILFVCLGNICRSPMAEGIFKAKAPYLDIESRATSSWEHHNPPYPKTVEILNKYNTDTSKMFSQKINQQDFKDFDYIIGMDRSNINDLKRMAPPSLHHKIHLYLDVNPDRKGQDVPDPWYNGKFAETEKLILETLPYWLEIFQND